MISSCPTSCLQNASLGGQRRRLSGRLGASSVKKAVLLGSPFGWGHLPTWPYEEEDKARVIQREANNDMQAFSTALILGESYFQLSPFIDFLPRDDKAPPTHFCAIWVTQHKQATATNPLLPRSCSLRYGLPSTSASFTPNPLVSPPAALP